MAVLGANRSTPRVTGARQSDAALVLGVGFSLAAAGIAAGRLIGGFIERRRQRKAEVVPEAPARQEPPPASSLVGDWLSGVSEPQPVHLSASANRDTILKTLGEETAGLRAVRERFINSVMHRAKLEFGKAAAEIQTDPAKTDEEKSAAISALQQQFEQALSTQFGSIADAWSAATDSICSVLQEVEPSINFEMLAPRIERSSEGSQFNASIRALEQLKYALAPTPKPHPVAAQIDQAIAQLVELKEAFQLDDAGIAKAQIQVATAAVRKQDYLQNDGPSFTGDAFTDFAKLDLPEGFTRSQLLAACEQELSQYDSGAKPWLTSTAAILNELRQTFLFTNAVLGPTPQGDLAPESKALLEAYLQLGGDQAKLALETDEHGKVTEEGYDVRTPLDARLSRITNALYDLSKKSENSAELTASIKNAERSLVLARAGLMGQKPAAETNAPTGASEPMDPNVEAKKTKEAQRQEERDYVRSFVEHQFAEKKAVPLDPKDPGVTPEHIRYNFSDADRNMLVYINREDFSVRCQVRAKDSSETKWFQLGEIA